MKNIRNHDGRAKIGKGVFYDVTAYSFRMSADFTTDAEAEAFVAQFPKYMRIKTSTLSTYTAQDGAYESYIIPTAVMSASFTADENNKGANEAGLKRVRKFLAQCRKLGIAITREYGFTNSVDFQEAE